MKTPRVSDHAVLRYMERVKGIDVDSIRSHIAQLCASAASAGATSLKAEGVEFNIDRTGSTVVTITPVNGYPSAAKKRQLAGHALRIVR